MDPHKNQSTETEDVEILLDPVIIRAELEEEVDVADLPAIDILEKQINNDYKKGRYPALIATGLLKDDFYGLVINQPLDLEPAFDTLKSEEVETSLNNIKIGTRKLVEQSENTRTREHSGWLWVEGNMTSEELDNYSNEVKYRIYLSPKPQNIGALLYELGTTIPKDVNYLMKTFDQTANSRELQRGDKIIMYCTDKNFDKIVNSVAKVVSKRPYLKDRPTPGGGAYSPMEGISFAKEVKGTSGSQIVASKIEKRLLENSFRKFCKDTSVYSNSEEMRYSREFQSLDRSINERSNEISKIIIEADNSGTFDKIINDENYKPGRNSEYLKYLIIKNISAKIYHLVSPMFEGYKNIVNGDLDYVNSQKGLGVETNNGINVLRDLLKNPPVKLQKEILSVFAKTMLTIKMENAINKGEQPGTALRELLKTL